MEPQIRTKFGTDVANVCSCSVPKWRFGLRVYLICVFFKKELFYPIPHPCGEASNFFLWLLENIWKRQIKENLHMGGYFNHFFFLICTAIRAAIPLVQTP